MTTQKMTDEHKFIVNKYLFPEFKEFAHILPPGLCGTCRLALVDKDNSEMRGEIPKSLPSCPDFSSVISIFQAIPPPTRSNPLPETQCPCKICCIGRSKQVDEALKKPGRGRPKVLPLDQRQTAKAAMMCTWCLLERAPGKPHVCSRAARLENLKRSMSLKGRQQLASSTIKETVEVSGTSNVSLSTSGTPLQVTAGTSRGQGHLNKPMSHADLLLLQKHTGISDRKLLLIAKALRSSLGRGSIEPYLAEAVAESGQKCQDFFGLKEMTFFDKDNEAATNHPTFKPRSILVPVCKNVITFVDFVLLQRKLGPDFDLKVGMDGGNGYFKVTLNVVSKIGLEQRSPSKSPDAKKTHFLDSGVKKLLLLAIVPHIPENYLNVKGLLSALNLSAFDLLTTLDLKLCNIVSGLQASSCSYPCYACEAHKSFAKKARLRTLGMLRKNAEAFEKDGARWEDAKDYKSSVYPPLFDQDDATLLLSLIPPPELHLLLGVVNRIFDQLNKEWGEDRAYKWAQSQNIARLEYRGGSMAGNACKKVLEKTEELAKALPKELLKFAEALYHFNSVRKSCFGQVLFFSYRSDIQKFKEAYLELNIPVSYKVHFVFEHIIDFCQMTGTSLGKYSEQACESSHYEFRQVFERVKVSPSHSEFPEHLLKATVIFNSKNI